jgi:DNA-directed RNA polymerase subunit RPC12/RpoP
MKTHNATIYHCVTCGRVVHAELKTKPPECCGHKMAKAATETIREGDVAGENMGGPSETAPPVSKGPKKPR